MTIEIPKHLPDWNENEFAKIPDQFQGGLRRYFFERIKPGDFLCAILENNLIDAVGRAADPVAYLSIKPIIEYLVNFAPAQAWGCDGDVEAWCGE